MFERLKAKFTGPLEIPRIRNLDLQSESHRSEQPGSTEPTVIFNGQTPATRPNGERGLPDTTARLEAVRTQLDAMRSARRPGPTRATSA